VTVWEAIILGLVQGLTEFLPVSSSGHLVIAQEFLGIDTPGLAFEVWLHLATLLAVTAALHREILGMALALLPGTSPEVRQRGFRFWVAIIVGTLPAIAVGLGLGDQVETAFSSLIAVGAGLLFTSLVLILSRFLRPGDKPLTPLRGLLIGAAQAVAIFPGVSRSGSTLTAGLAVGLPAVEAARFAFLLSFPAILGAAVLKADSLMELGQTAHAPLVLGFLASAVSGYAAIRVVWRVMERGRLWMFAPYCAVVGAVVLYLGFG